LKNPTLSIKCVEKESNEINGQFIGVNVIHGKIGTNDFEFPEPAATQIDLKRSNRTHIPIKTNIIQYYHQDKYNNSLKKIRHAGSLLKKFEKMVKINPQSIPDINFDYVRDYKITPQERDFMIRIQGEIDNSPFISDIELDRNQSLQKFIEQLKTLEEKYPEKIICPTIDFNALPQIFLQKLQYIVSENYQRFNVIFGGFIKRQENWLALSKEIFGKPIWCNVVSLQQRFETFSDPFVSNISIAFAYGIHTISVGYPRMEFDDDDEPKEPIPRLLNQDTLIYENTDKYTKPQSVVHSFNNQQAEAQTMRESVGKEFFKEYAKKDGLQNHLSQIKRRT